MDCVQESIEKLVSAGIRSYIGLLGCGERERSRRLFKDTLEISALVAGGPSARLSPLLATVRPGSPGPAAGHGGAQSAALCMVLLTLRSILATLLVLKASPYWRRVPVLDELQDHCAAVADLLDRDPPPKEAPRLVGTCERASGRTAGGLNSNTPMKTDAVCGCSRNNALPTGPELSEQPAAGAPG